MSTHNFAPPDRDERTGVRNRTEEDADHQCRDIGEQQCGKRHGGRDIREQTWTYSIERKRHKGLLVSYFDKQTKLKSLSNLS